MAKLVILTINPTLFSDLACPRSILKPKISPHMKLIEALAEILPQSTLPFAPLSPVSFFPQAHELDSSATSLPRASFFIPPVGQKWSPISHFREESQALPTSFPFACLIPLLCFLLVPRFSSPLSRAAKEQQSHFLCRLPRAREYKATILVFFFLILPTTAAHLPTLFAISYKQFTAVSCLFLFLLASSLFPSENITPYPTHWLAKTSKGAPSFFFPVAEITENQQGSSFPLLSGPWITQKISKSSSPLLFGTREVRTQQPRGKAEP